MQTSPIAETPRIVEIKPLQNPSHLRPSPSTPSLLTGIKKTPSISRRLTFQGFHNETKPEPVRSSSAVGTRTLSSTHLRWPSASSPKKVSPTTIMTPPVTMRARTSAGEQQRVDTDRESMHALAEFLRTRPPPPHNYMSQPDSDDEARYSHSGFGKLVNRRHGRSNGGRKKVAPLMQLPDSAVAATTTEGYRHIAISIPHRYELDGQDTEKPLPQLPASPSPVPSPVPVPPKTKKQQRGPVVVLKPVQEVKSLAQCMDQIKEERPAPTKRAASSPAPMHIAALARSPVKKTVLVKRSKPTTPATSPVPPKSAPLPLESVEKTPKQQPLMVIERGIKIQITHEPRASESTIGSSTSKGSDQSKSLIKSSISSATSHGSSTSHAPRPATAPRLPSSMTLENALKAAAARIHAFEAYREDMDTEGEAPEMLRRELFDNPNATVADDPDELVSPLSPVPLEMLLPPQNGEQTLRLDTTTSLQVRPMPARPLSMAFAAAHVIGSEAGSLSRVPSLVGDNDAYARTRSSNPVSPATSAVAPNTAWNRDVVTERPAPARVMTNMMVVASIRPSSPSRPASPIVFKSSWHMQNGHLERSHDAKQGDTRTNTMLSQSSAAMTISTDPCDKPLRSDRTSRTPVDSGFPSSSSPSSLTSNRPRRMKSRREPTSHPMHQLDDDLDEESGTGTATDTDMLSVRRRERRERRNSMIRSQTVEARLKRLEVDNRIMLEALSGIAGGFSVLRTNGLLDTTRVTQVAPKLDGSALARRRIEGWTADVEEQNRWSGGC